MATYSDALPQVFRALADPTRLAVIERLANGPASVSDLGQPFDMARPSFLKHLGVLERAALVRSEKTGRVRTVYLEPAALDWVDQWVNRHRRRWESRLDDLGDFLDQETLQDEQ